MQIKKVLELPEGKVEFNANLSDEEVQMVLEVGLNVLLAHGTVPFIGRNRVAEHDLHITAGSTVN